MTKLNKAQLNWLKNYAMECGSCEKTHRKYSTFYVAYTLMITEAIIGESEEEGINISPSLCGKVLVATGTWCDEDGTDIGDLSFYSIEQTMNPKYVALMTRAQEDELLQEFIKEHCEEYVTKYVGFEVEVY
ncbi:tail tube protein [Citrobacter phage vB_CbrM_HP1]|uniref:Tail tube protein n=1 Tax=Citrobacter phage vB_CbrM_HP1 TaxID=2876111 RepID=A0AAE9CHG5_9CAUD|nr:tail tube protein [Citrobacter phage vB_CbrM_HP1]